MEETLIILIISVVAFFIFRGLVLWYWKINRIVNLLESIDSKLSGKRPRSEQNTKQCPSCGSKYNPNDYREDITEIKCSACGASLSTENPPNTEPKVPEKTVSIEPSLYEDLDVDSECIVCNTIIPKGEKSCPKCGWSYSQ